MNSEHGSNDRKILETLPFIAASFEVTSKKF